MNCALCIVNYLKDILQVIIAEFLLLGEEADERLERTAEEGVLHLFHELACVLHACQEGIEVEGLVTFLSLAETDELLGGEYLHEGGYGAVGWPRFGVFGNDGMRTHGLALVPEYVHNLHLGFGQRMVVFLASHKWGDLMFSICRRQR